MPSTVLSIQYFVLKVIDVVWVDIKTSVYQILITVYTFLHA